MQKKIGNFPTFPQQIQLGLLSLAAARLGHTWLLLDFRWLNSYCVKYNLVLTYSPSLLTAHDCLIQKSGIKLQHHFRCLTYFSPSPNVTTSCLKCGQWSSKNIFCLSSPHIICNIFSSVCCLTIFGPLCWCAGNDFYHPTWNVSWHFSQSMRVWSGWWWWRGIWH